jgi:hypothetical protein
MATKRKDAQGHAKSGEKRLQWASIRVQSPKLGNPTLHSIIGRRYTVSLLNLAALRGKGTRFDEGICFLALHVTKKHIEKAEMTWNNENNVVCGLDLAFTEAIEVTGLSKSKFWDLFNSYSVSNGASFVVGVNTTRGRASENCDRTSSTNSWLHTTTRSAPSLVPKLLEGCRQGAIATFGCVVCGLIVTFSLGLSNNQVTLDEI